MYDAPRERIGMGRFVVSVTVALLAVLLLLSGRAYADLLFQENFDSPIGADHQVLFAADAVYDGIGGPTGGDHNGNAYGNGYIVTSTTEVTYPFGGMIPVDQGGSGYFLFEGTDLNHPDVSYGSPNDPKLIFGTLAAIPVLPNSTYELSFWLHGGDANPAQIAPYFNGSQAGIAAGPPAGFSSPLGSGAGWTQAMYEWDSGAATSVNLGLFNLVDYGGAGNDFGIDNIAFSGPAAAVPAPSTQVLLGSALTVLIGWSLRRIVSWHQAEL